MTARQGSGVLCDNSEGNSAAGWGKSNHDFQKKKAVVLIPIKKTVDEQGLKQKAREDIQIIVPAATWTRVDLSLE